MIWTATEIASALRVFRGQRLLGVIDDGHGAVEVVFEYRAAKSNLLSLHENGVASIGHVDDPDRYLSELQR